MGREEYVDIFKDTERLVKTNRRIADYVKSSAEKQELILEGDKLPEVNKERYAENANIVVSKKRSFEAAKAYGGTKTAVHNFASASHPGGGVVNGARAQEECLCRCSGLYFCLNTKKMWDGFYNPHRNAHDPIHNDDIIYTPDVTVFKTDSAIPALMPETEWYDVDVITCAAPNLRSNPSNRFNPGDGVKAVLVKDKELLDIHVKRLRRILDVAVLYGCESVILGAFGCGAFENSPEMVARAAHTVIGEYLRAFKNIEFAVYCSPKDERNFTTFQRVLKPYC